MNIHFNPPCTENDIETFRRIRKIIGWLGIGLPVTLVFLSLIPFFRTGVQNSISSYYYTNFRELFTGVLCAVSLFLIRYKGTENPVLLKNDSLLTNIAGVLALLVALFPTNPGDCTEKIYTLIPRCEPWLGWLHLIFAALFFLILAVISINVFTIGQNVENKEIPVSFLNENYLYRGCGYAIILFVILIPVCDTLKLFQSSTLVLEALALFAFGIAWLIKGRFLGDRGMVGRVLYRERN
jgi:hypothetical protein